VNTCAGCLPKVTGVQKSPKVAAETAAEGKFLTTWPIIPLTIWKKENVDFTKPDMWPQTALILIQSIMLFVVPSATSLSQTKI